MSDRYQNTDTTARIFSEGSAKLDEMAEETGRLLAQLNMQSSSASSSVRRGLRNSGGSAKSRRTARRLQQILQEHLSSANDSNPNNPDQLEEKHCESEGKTETTRNKEPINASSFRPEPTEDVENLQIENLYEKYKTLCVKEGIILGEETTLSERPSRRKRRESPTVAGKRRSPKLVPEEMNMELKIDHIQSQPIEQVFTTNEVKLEPRIDSNDSNKGLRSERIFDTQTNNRLSASKHRSTQTTPNFTFNKDTQTHQNSSSKKTQTELIEIEEDIALKYTSFRDKLTSSNGDNPMNSSNFVHQSNVYDGPVEIEGISERLQFSANESGDITLDSMQKPEQGTNYDEEQFAAFGLQNDFPQPRDHRLMDEGDSFPKEFEDFEDTPEDDFARNGFSEENFDRPEDFELSGQFSHLDLRSRSEVTQDDLYSEQNDNDTLFYDSDNKGNQNMDNFDYIAIQFEMDKQQRNLRRSNVRSQNKHLEEERRKRLQEKELIRSQNMSRSHDGSTTRHSSNGSSSHNLWSGISPTDERIKQVSERKHKLDQERFEAALEKEARILDKQQQLSRRSRIPIKYFAQNVPAPKVREHHATYKVNELGAKAKYNHSRPGKIEYRDLSERPDWVDITRKDWAK